MELKNIEDAKIAAMKEKNKPRVDAIKLLINEINLIAKTDKNRQPNEDDIITAANRLTKKANETLSYMDDTDERKAKPQYEISVMAEFLPEKMSDEELMTILTNYISNAPVEGKAVRGYIMKELNSNYKGQFDPRSVNEKLSGMI